MASQVSGGKRPKSAAERRAQGRQAEGRAIQRLLRSFDDILGHRGSFLGRLGSALAELLGCGSSPSAARAPMRASAPPSSLRANAHVFVPAVRPSFGFSRASFTSKRYFFPVAVPSSMPSEAPVEASAGGATVNGVAKYLVSANTRCYQRGQRP